MQIRCGALFATAIVLLVALSGCLDMLYERPVPLSTPAPTLLPVITPSPGSPAASAAPSDMALKLADLPPDYFLRDRSVIAYDEIPQVNRDLGWRQGYSVSFYRMNLQNEDITGITQKTGVYSPESMINLYEIEKEALLSSDHLTERYEIPFPVTGDRSIAVREMHPDDRFRTVSYTVIFTKKNVFEKISMTGTTTDYEVLRDVVKTAAEKIR